MDKKTSKISWIFGSILLLIGISSTFILLNAYGILMIIAGCFLIPPVRNKFHKITEIEIKGWLRGVIVSLLIINFFTLSQEPSTNKPGNKEVAKDTKSEHTATNKKVEEIENKPCKNLEESNLIYQKNMEEKKYYDAGLIIKQCLKTHENNQELKEKLSIAEINQYKFNIENPQSRLHQLLNIENLERISPKEAEKFADLKRKLKNEIESKWNYQAVQDDMSNKNIFFATNTSRNYINFDFPYSGEQQATLQIRNHPRHGRDIILSIEKGQFLCGYNDCYVLVKFDDSPPVRFSASSPNDHSSEHIFINSYQKFIDRMKKSKEVRIEARFYREGAQSLIFDTTGFDQQKMSN